MAYFTKEEYEGKLAWRRRRNEEQIKKGVLSEECCDAIAELHSVRHDFHCGSTFLCESADFDLAQSLLSAIEEVNSFESETGLKCQSFDWSEVPSDDWLDLECEERELDEEAEDYEDKRDDIYTDLEESHDDIKEKINENVRNFIEKINEKFGLEY